MKIAVSDTNQYDICILKNIDSRFCNKTSTLQMEIVQFLFRIDSIYQKSL